MTNRRWGIGGADAEATNFHCNDAWVFNETECRDLPIFRVGWWRFDGSPWINDVDVRVEATDGGEDEEPRSPLLSFPSSNASLA